jgi:hypothetical protein
MREETIERLVKELAAEYENVCWAAEGCRTLVSIPKVYFPDGCVPASAPALVILDEAQAAPQLFLKILPKLPNGKDPRSISAATVAGESWSGYSFNQPWDENTHTAVQFVEGRLRRFALKE